jgi:hypothetical protein
MAHPIRGAHSVVTAGLLAALWLASAGCAATAAAHDGYPEASAAEPWTDARELELDARGETEVIDTVSYTDRQRARWYAVELAAPGRLRARLSPVTFGRDRPSELGLEVYDARFGLLGAGAGRQPGGDLTQTADELEPGRYYVHVFATERDGVADFALRLIFERSGTAGSAAFPESVAFPSELPAVPEVDDAPHEPPQRARRRAPPAPEPRAQPVAARIAGITVTDRGTRIRINRGGNHGIARGWQGVVTSSGGQPIPGGRFTIDQVTPQEAFGTVSASVDAVTAARHVRLTPP